MSRHLGDLTAAFVDDQLDAGERARALRHLSGCERCAGEVAAQRQVKKRLNGLRPPAVPALLAARLLDVPNAPIGSETLPGDSDPAGEGDARAGAAGASHTVATAAFAGARPSAPGERPPPRPSTGGGPSGKPGAVAGSRARRQRRGVRTIVLSSASALVVCMGVFGVAFAVGGPPQEGHPVSPPMPAYVAEHASVSNDVPLSDPALTTVTSRVLP